MRIAAAAVIAAAAGAAVGDSLPPEVAQWAGLLDGVPAVALLAVLGQRELTRIDAALGELRAELRALRDS